MEKLVSNFQLVMALRRDNSYIVDFGDGVAGLYVTGLRNAHGTPLAAKGTRAELEALVRENGGGS